MIKTAILTISTRGSRGEQDDTSGEIIKEMIQAIDGEIVDYRLIPDEKDLIIEHLRRMADEVDAALIITTGGTGLSPDDVTPEATLEVIDRRIPGFEEAMRMNGFKNTPHALLSRGVAGTYKKSLIINLPGSPKGVGENLQVILPAIPHGISILQNARNARDEHRFSAL